MPALRKGYGGTHTVRWADRLVRPYGRTGKDAGKMPALRKRRLDRRTPKEKSTELDLCTDPLKNGAITGLDAAVTFAILRSGRYPCTGRGERCPGFQTYEVRLVTNTG